MQPADQPLNHPAKDRGNLQRMLFLTYTLLSIDLILDINVQRHKCHLMTQVAMNI